MDRLNRQIAELTDLLALERSTRRELEDTLGSLESTLSESEAEQARLQAMLDAGEGVSDRAEELAEALVGRAGSDLARGKPDRHPQTSRSRLCRRQIARAGIRA